MSKVETAVITFALTILDPDGRLVTATKITDRTGEGRWQCRTVRECIGEYLGGPALGQAEWDRLRAGGAVSRTTGKGYSQSVGHLQFREYREGEGAPA